MRVTSICFDGWFAPLSKLVTLIFSSEVSDQVETISHDVSNDRVDMGYWVQIVFQFCEFLEIPDVGERLG
jgi:hypothetical protein